MSTIDVTRPYFFQENNHTVTVNSVEYMVSAEWHYGSYGKARHESPSRNVSRMPDFKIWKHSLASKIPRPDSHTDFSLWGHLKSKVYVTCPRPIYKLKDCIIKGTGRNDGALLESCRVSERNHTSD
jgi:hypothetical protein